MKVKDLIRDLSTLDPEESVCALWWDSSGFDVDSDAWEDACQMFERDYGYLVTAVADEIAEIVSLAGGAQDSQNS